MPSLLDNDQIKDVTKLPYALDLPEGFNPQTHGRFEILDSKAGDVKIMWNRTNTEEVEAARETFNRLKKKGYVWYKAEGKDGTKGEVVKEFDPNVERMIAVPVVTGG